MTAKLTKNQMRQMGLHNSWDIARAAGNNLYISYMPAESGRAAHYAFWQVVGIGIKTDKDAVWFHYGHKTFDVGYREDKPIKLKEAMGWCHKKYGTLGFEKDPFGGYQVMGTMRRILKKREDRYTATRNREKS